MIFNNTIVFALIAAITCGGSAHATPTDTNHIRQQVNTVFPQTQTDYRWFHQHPELSLEETKTAAYMAEALERIGLEVHANIGGNGVVGILRNRKYPKGHTVLYRADMDALPLSEATGLSYASKHPGVMHACGHDIHMATALGTLRILRNSEDLWRGTILFIGQPAEELGKGARAVLGDPRFKNILKKTGKPRVALALHDAADLSAGKVALLDGFTHANVDSVDIEIIGRGAHGAQPQNAIDPIVIGAELVMALQTIVARKLNPRTPAVITVGMFSAGTKHNIIPKTATLLLTVRSYGDATRKRLLDEIRHLAIYIARAHHAPEDPHVTVRDEHTPSVYGDPVWTARIRTALVEALGPDNVTTHTPAMYGEDFGQYARMLKIPGVIYRLGAVSVKTLKRADAPGLHASNFAPSPEPTLKTGMISMVTALAEALRPN